MAKTTNPTVISALELNKVRDKSQQIGALRQALQSAEVGMRDSLELIGDRYGVDLVSGEYAVKADGSVVKSADLKEPGELGEGKNSAKQLLTEEGE